jgi:hypothetical protein
MKGAIMAEPKYEDPDTHTMVHGPAAADVPTGSNATAADGAAAINAVLEALRSANIIAGS